MKAGNSRHALKLCGCTSQDLRAHIEHQFKNGMDWENWGAVWEIDHIRPVSSFQLWLHHERLACWHWTNMQPLWKVENRSKGGKWQESDKKGQ